MSDKKYNSGNTQDLVYTLKHDTCLNKKFSIVFYLIQDSSLSLDATPSNTAYISYSLSVIMSRLNEVFSPICVSFEHCKTVIIPHWPHNNWKAFNNGAMITSTWYTENTINVYIPEEIDIPLFDPPGETAYAYSPPSGTAAPKNAIVFTKKAIDPNNPNALGSIGSSIMHAFGIFFGLPHTYDEINPGSVPSPAPPNNTIPAINTLEYVDHINIQNCREHGDGFCDTEADPFPSSLLVPSPIPTGDGGCSSPAGMVDGNGTPYLPPSDNFMSHYNCRCRFTQEQYNYMAYIILTKRLYLH